MEESSVRGVGIAEGGGDGGEGDGGARAGRGGGGGRQWVKEIRWGREEAMSIF